jgi:hypothetical protein
MLDNLRDHSAEDARMLLDDEQRDIRQHQRLAHELAQFGRVSRALARLGIGAAAWHVLEVRCIEGKVLARREMFGNFCDHPTLDNDPATDTPITNINHG